MKQTQGRRVIEALKKRRMTYLEMLMLGVSVCPWKRVKESLKPGERLDVGKRGELVTWRVVRG